jgi:hypothetical protein
MVDLHLMVALQFAEKLPSIGDPVVDRHRDLNCLTLLLFDHVENMILAILNICRQTSDLDACLAIAYRFGVSKSANKNRRLGTLVIFRFEMVKKS